MANRALNREIQRRSRVDPPHGSASHPSLCWVTFGGTLIRLAENLSSQAAPAARHYG